METHRMITFVREGVRFTHRVAGIAIDDGCILLHQFEGESFLALPCGLAESLVPPGPSASDPDAEEVGEVGEVAPISLGRLALALMGGEVLDADRLVAVLTAPGPYLPPSSWPDNDELAEVALVTRSFGPRRTRQLLVDAAGSTDGPARLVATARMWREVRDHFQGRLPMGLDDLEALCRQLSPHDPVDRPPPLVGRTRPVA